jgi:beta-galactosidase
MIARLTAHRPRHWLRATRARRHFFWLRFLLAAAGTLLASVGLAGANPVAPPISGPFLGTHYYRPPSPRPEDFDRDLASIKAHGLKLIRVWVLWTSVNPRPSVWRWDDFDRLFDLAEKHGLKILLQLKWDAAPAWYDEAHPEQRYVSATGAPTELHAAAGQAPTGGYPGFCQHHDGARAAVLDYVRRIVERYRTRPGLAAYDLWNEVQLPDCHCPATERHFQRWLATHYQGAIASLNRKYATDYERFDEVRLPKRGVYSNLIDVTDFRQHVSAEHMEALAGAVRALDSRHLVGAHWGSQVAVLSNLSEHKDAWRLATPLDLWGNSSHVNERELSEAVLVEDVLRSVSTRDSAQGRPWWLGELAGGSNYLGMGYRESTEAERRLRALLAFSYGAQAVIYWQWRPALFGQEASHWGLTGPDGEPTRRSDDVRQLAAMLERHREILGQLKWRPPEVALLHDPRNVAFEKMAPGRDKFEESVGARNFHGYFRALLEGGHDPEILHAGIVARSGVPPWTKFLILPFYPIERPGLHEQLAAWVAGGGTLLAGPALGMLDEAAWLNPQQPSLAWQRVFGARQVDRFYVPTPMVSLPAQAIPPRPAKGMPGQLLYELYRLQGAQSLGTVQDKPAITSNSYGKGRALMMGSFFGAAYSPRESTLRRFLDSVATQAGVRSPIASSGAFVRVADSPQGPVIFLFNFATSPIDAEISLDASGRVLDLWSNRELGEIQPRQPWRTKLPGKGSQIVLVARP